MARNFKEPPLYVKLADQDMETATVEWSQWFNDIHFVLSTKNHQTIKAAQPLNLNAQYINLNSTAGAFAITLAAPERPGIIKTIEMTVDGGDVTLSLANVVGGSAGTTCTWNSVQDTLVLQSISDKWLVITEHGVSLT